MADNENDRHNNEQLWPAAEYYQQVARLQQAIGEKIYLAELKDTSINAGVTFTDAPLILLNIVEYPQPDPYRRLCPHMLILDDGRGVNLGRVVRVSLNKAFGPAQDDVLFRDSAFMDEVLLAPRVLSRESIAQTSQGILSQILGDEPGRLLQTTLTTEPKQTQNNYLQPARLVKKGLKNS